MNSHYTKEADTDATTKRESKLFWAADDFHNICQVTGFACSEPNGDVWWVPELGYSLSEKHHLFKTASEARELEIAKLKSNITDLQTALTRLEAEREQA